MPFPTNFPLTAIPTVVGFLRGSGVGRRAAAEAAYDLLGYAAGTLIPEDGPQILSMQSDDHSALADGHLAAQLEELKADLDANPTAAFSLPPWLVPVLLEVLRRVLTS